MKLKSVSIKNFKSIKELEFEFPESGILVLIGANNAGKSNIIRAINAICGEGWYGKDKLEDYDFYQRKRNNQIEINLSFDNGSIASIKPTSKDWGMGYFNSKNIKIYTLIKDDFPCTYLSADRTLDKDLSFYDWTLIGRIRKAFHNKASIQNRDKIETAFNNMISLFEEVEGFTAFKEDFVAFYKELLPLNSNNVNIEFKPYTPANLFKTMQILATDPNLNDAQIDLTELGEGARNMVLIALLRSYAKNLKGGSSGILALEEPELYLHPQARRHLFDVLKSITKQGIQVIISTHSDSFVDISQFDSIGRVVKIMDPDGEEGKCTSLQTVSKTKLVNFCRQTGVPQSKCTVESIGMFYGSTSNYRLNEAFFSNLLVIVEGETEEMALPIYLKQFGINCDAFGISILGVGGKGQIPKYWRLFKSFNIPIIVMFDSDHSLDSSNQKYKNNILLCGCFGFEMTEIIDNIDEVKFLEKEQLVGDFKEYFIIADGDFEKSICKSLGKPLYDQFELKARDVVKPIGNNQQKGIISQFIAKEVIANDENFKPRLVLELAKCINNVLSLGLSLESEAKTALDLDDEFPF